MKKTLLFAGLLLLTLCSRAQVVYKDAYPDIFIETNGPANNTVDLDLDSNGVVDFTAYCYWGHPSNNMYEAEPNLYSLIDSNLIVKDPIDPGICIAAMMHIGDTVSSILYWQNPDSCSYLTVQTDWMNPAPFYFVGVRFLIGTQKHYGWIRYKTDGFSTNYTAYCNLVIYDWAYETQPDSSIIIGEGWNGVAENAAPAVNIFSSAHTITIQPADNSEMQVTVFDVFGNRVAAKENLRGNNSIELPEAASGIYLVEVKQDGKVLTKKVLLN